MHVISHVVARWSRLAHVRSSCQCCTSLPVLHHSHLLTETENGRPTSARPSFTSTLLFLTQFYAAKRRSFWSSHQQHTNHTLHRAASNTARRPSRRSLSYGALGPTLQGPLNASRTIAHCNKPLDSKTPARCTRTSRAPSDVHRFPSV